jgi:hypothetical protein
MLNGKQSLMFQRNVMPDTQGQTSPFVQDRRLPLWFIWILLSAGLLRSVGLLSTDVLRQPVDLILKGQMSLKLLEDGA